MKHKFFGALIALSMLSACSSGLFSTPSSSVTSSGNNSVELTLTNYTDYIASYRRYMSDSYVVYDFVGSTLCRFDEAEISYCFLLIKTEEVDDNRTIYTTKLTISGDGQSELSEYYSKYSHRNYLKVTAVSGTVTFIG